MGLSGLGQCQPVINCCCAVRLLWECWSFPPCTPPTVYARQPPYLVVLASRLGWSAGLLGRHDGITVEPAAALCFLGSQSSHHLMVPLSETTGTCCWHGRYFERLMLALCSVQHYLFAILSRPLPSRAPDGTKDSLQLGNEGSPRTSRYGHTLTRKARSADPPRSYCRSVSHHHQKIRRQTDRQT